MQVFLNNKFYPKEKAKVSIFDHGFLYGDGIFETLRTYNRKVFKVEEHVWRLFHSAKLINLQIPLSKAEIKNAIILAVKKNNAKDAYVRITISRGVGDIGYTAKCEPNVVIIVKELKPYPKEIFEKGVSIITYEAERFLPKVKSTNCLPLVLAKNKAERKKCFEAILADNSEFITEGTVSNVCFVKKNILYANSGNMLEGITRQVVMGLAKKFIEVIETKIKKSEIYDFDECFLTSTISEIVPVVKIDEVKIGNGLPGKITRKLMGEFKKLAK